MAFMWFDILIIVLLFLLCTFFGLRWQRQVAVRRWRRALALDKHQAVFQQLYADIDGFRLSKIARTGQDAPEYVYGEIDFESFIALLSLCNPKPSTIFYDLGSGIGKAVLACTMVFEVQKSCGIELFASLDQCAKVQQGRLRQIPGYQEKANRVEFKQGNLLEAQFSDASLIFINATAFFGKTWDLISKQAEQIKSGSLVISTSKALDSSVFLTVTVTQVKMSWGIVEAFIQQRLGP
jgi:Histone methylation protein DOT1